MSCKKCQLVNFLYEERKQFIKEHKRAPTLKEFKKFYKKIYWKT